MNPAITFDESLKAEILDMFDKAIDAEGFIIDRASGKRILSPEGYEIPVKEWAGIKRGPSGLMFIKNDLPSLIKHFMDEYEL